MTGTVLPQAALEIKGINRHFGGLLALRDVSIRVQPQEVVGLIGPNGAGKSTLFEIISGNMPPSSGEVSFFGNDITSLAPHLRRREGLCRTFQKIRLFSGLSVAQNIAVAAQQCMDGGNWRDEVDAVLVKLRLSAQANKYPHEVTLADRKKIEIARAIVGKCRVLMLDECLSGLTRDEADEVVEEILLLNRQGLTIIVVEHVMPVVMAMAQRLVVLQQGAVIADGPPALVAANPLVIEAYLGVKHQAPP